MIFEKMHTFCYIGFIIIFAASNSKNGDLKLPHSIFQLLFVFFLRTPKIREIFLKWFTASECSAAVEILYFLSQKIHSALHRPNYYLQAMDDYG